MNFSFTKLFLVVFCALISLHVSAQRSCGSMHHYHQMIAESASFQFKQSQLEEKTALYNAMLPSMNVSSATYTIPVVIHILYSNSLQNISDDQINSQMKSLNEDFRALNADFSSIPQAFQAVAADVNIDFCLAQVDPNGNPTTGINRVSTTTTSFSYTNEGMKFSSSGGVDAWNTNLYLNIWVCNLSGGLLGYAQFPGGSSSTDGVVVNYTAFGSEGTASSPYNLGRTLTHEIGHWLNLRHIWGDSFCGNDFVVKILVR